jgi:magnesium-transporting ATPase (P-type)
MFTEMGKIAAALKTAKKAENKLTPLQQALNRLGGMIGAISITVLILIVIIAVVRKYRDPAHPGKSPTLMVIMVAVGFAVSSVPEGLPMVVTICLALGCQDMVARKAQVRQLPAVETLGSCSVICSDKTGTLTEGKMTALRMFTFVRGLGQGVQGLSFYPTKGFNPNGGCFLTDELTLEKKDAMDKLYDQNVFQKFDPILTDYGNPSTQQPGSGPARALITAGYLNSYGTTLKKDPEDPTGWRPKGNMSEGAIVVAAAKCRIGPVVNDGKDLGKDFALVKELEVPFTSARKMMVTVHKCLEGKPGELTGVGFGSVKDAKHFAIIKGAPEMILPLAQYGVVGEGSGGTMDFSSPMSKAESDLVLQANSGLAEGALRVLAFGVMPLNDADMEALQGCGKADVRLTWMKEPARKICFMGLLGSLDPPRVGVKEAIQVCRESGIRVIMITGDQVNTAARSPRTSAC